MIAVLDYGIGNLRSAEKALQHLGADARLVDDPDRAAAADAVVLPGVGAFGRCAQALRSSGLDLAAAEAVERGCPSSVSASASSSSTRGPTRIPDTRAWDPAGHGAPAARRGQAPPDAVEPARAVRPPPRPACWTGLPDPAWVYFVHSFAPERTADTTSMCHYGRAVVATGRTGPGVGHPVPPREVGRVGLGILANFVDAVAPVGRS